MTTTTEIPTGSTVFVAIDDAVYAGNLDRVDDGRVVVTIPVMHWTHRCLPSSVFATYAEASAYAKG